MTPLCVVRSRMRIHRLWTTVLCALAAAAGEYRAHAETIDVPFATCGGVKTAGSYSGLVLVTVSGWGIATPGNPGYDAFYSLAVADPSVAVQSCPTCFRFSR